MFVCADKVPEAAYYMGEMHMRGMLQEETEADGRPNVVRLSGHARLPDSWNNENTYAFCHVPE